MNRRLSLLQIASVALASGAGCDYSGDFLFADVPDIDPIIHIEPPEGGFVVPAVIESVDQVGPATIYAEVGATSSDRTGGATLNFQGTGRAVCVWVDPEMAFWNQKVGQGNSPISQPWTYPDNIYDDGDIDLFVGESVFYSGSAGEAMGDFVLEQKDSLGHEVPIDRDQCTNRGYNNVINAHAGKGTAEYCSIPATDLGKSYTAALHTFSTPLDDDRMAFGVIVFDGNCTDLKTLGGAASMVGEECLIKGEGIVPQGSDWGPWFGSDAIVSWEHSEQFESDFCSGALPDFCLEEAERVNEEDSTCGWAYVGDDLERCFCGDPYDTPSGGAG